MKPKIERTLLDEFITLHLIQLIPNGQTTKCSFTIVAGGAAEYKVARYAQGSENSKVDRLRSMRSKHVGMERKIDPKYANNMFERMLLEGFVTLHLIQPVPNDLTTKCSSIVAAGGAAKDKIARHKQGGEDKKADGSRSMRSEHVDMRGWQRSAKRAARYIGSGFSGSSRASVRCKWLQSWGWAAPSSLSFLKASPFVPQGKRWNRYLGSRSVAVQVAAVLGGVGP
jgi:hypothetical protein